MAQIIKFPTEQQRYRSRIEKILNNALSAIDSLTPEKKTRLRQIILAQFDRYSIPDLSVELSAPDSQPFTDAQIASIKTSMQSLQNNYSDQLSTMFLGLLTVHVELFIQSEL